MLKALEPEPPVHPSTPFLHTNLEPGTRNLHKQMLRSFLRCLLFASLVGVFLPERAPAQSIPALSEASTVSMLTILPGDAVYAEFGHSTFRVRDPVLGIDRVYNYGTFDFSDPAFIPKFIYGQLDYMLSVTPYEPTYRHYENEGRPIIEQHLRLDQMQRQALFRFLEINARPENRTYRYDFLFDNCSTRIRDALEASVGDAVRFTPQPDPNETFRRLLDPWVADRPLLDVGFDLGLGTPTDRIATPREAMFLPIYLMEAFDHAAIERDGTTDPLVAETDTTLWFEDYEATEQTFPWPRWIAWTGLLLALGLTVRGVVRGTHPHRRLDAFFFGLVGLAGSLIVFLWFLSEHTVTNQNWNLLWAWPTHLVAAVVLWRNPKRDALRLYCWIGAGATLLTALGWPLWPQDLHAAVLPVVLLLALRLARQAYALREHPPATAVG